MKCPTCFASLPSLPAKVACVGSCAPAVNAPGTAVLGYEVRTRPIFDVPQPTAPGANPAVPKCPKCSTPSTQEVCGYCFAEVPPRWRQAKVTCIALAGARATGKSLMLAVAKEQLSLLIERHHRSVLTGIGNTDAWFEEHYTKPLYEQRELLPPTPGALTDHSTVRKPMIFQFNERFADGSARSRIMVLRDVAGEDLEQFGGMDKTLGFYHRADAVIALLDPLTVSQIRGMLADLIPGDALTGGDGVAVLRHVLKLMTGGDPGGRTPIPLAVVLSKVDTLQRMTEVKNTTWASIMDRPGSPLQRDPSLKGAAYDVNDGELLHEEVVGLLEELRAGTLTAMLHDTADRFHYFAASSLGESPEGEMVHAGGIAPFRVLDPFKWALHVTS